MPDTQNGYALLVEFQCKQIDGSIRRRAYEHAYFAPVKGGDRCNRRRRLSGSRGTINDGKMGRIQYSCNGLILRCV